MESQGKKGVMFKQPPEIEAFQRWQSGEFLNVERTFARVWRAGLSGVDLERTYRDFQPYFAGHKKPKDLTGVREFAEQILGEWEPYRVLQLGLDLLGIPADRHDAILARWRLAGQPRLREFARYATHVVTVDLVFCLGVAADLIGRDRSSNKVDMAYLYYMPFTMVFASNDKLHARMVPVFLHDGQVFVDGIQLKADLKRLDEFYIQLPEEVRKRGTMSFSAYPPQGEDYLVTRFWDRFLPKWRENVRKEKKEISKESEAKIVTMLKEFNDKARPPGPGGSDRRSRRGPGDVRTSRVGPNGKVASPPARGRRSRAQGCRPKLFSPDQTDLEM